MNKKINQLFIIHFLYLSDFCLIRKKQNKKTHF